jgi:hypothetical protein
VSEQEWDRLIFWCVVRARVTGVRQRIYSNRIGGVWRYWSTAASAGYHSDGSAGRREIAAVAERMRRAETQPSGHDATGITEDTAPARPAVRLAEQNTLPKGSGTVASSDLSTGFSAGCRSDF